MYVLAGVTSQCMPQTYCGRSKLNQQPCKKKTIMGEHTQMIVSSKEGGAGLPTGVSNLRKRSVKWSYSQTTCQARYQRLLISEEWK